jgi:hypothetical protein
MAVTFSGISFSGSMAAEVVRPINVTSNITLNETGSNTQVSLEMYGQPDVTYYWTIDDITTSNVDFAANTGIFTLAAGVATFNIQAVADLFTEGTETARLSIRTGSVSGPIIARSDITVNDTSLSLHTGQSAYTTAGTYSWVAPAATTSVAVVAVGGGGGSFSSPGGVGAVRIIWPGINRQFPSTNTNDLTPYP